VASEDGEVTSEAKLMGVLVNAAIPFLVGIFCLLVGFRVIGSKPGVDAKFDAMHARFGTFFKVAGPVLMIIAIVLLAMGNKPE
jgi:hypothetical protein